MYYWIFQFYRQTEQVNVFGDVTNVEVKADSYEQAEEKAVFLIKDVVSGRLHRLKEVVLAEK